MTIIEQLVLIVLLDYYCDQRVLQLLMLGMEYTGIKPNQIAIGGKNIPPPLYSFCHLSQIITQH